MDTWAASQKHYFPVEFSPVWDYLDSYVSTHSTLPSFPAANLAIRDANLRERFFALEKVDEVDIDGKTLLEYLKNEFTQIEIMNQLEKYLTNSIAMESASENIEGLQIIVLEVEGKVDLKDVNEDMRRMSLFEPEESLIRNVPLGLNAEYDRLQTFGPTELVLIGGKKGTGKSVTCANIAASMYEAGNSVIYFTIEMTPRAIMQRCCSISTGIPQKALRTRNLSVKEWETLAEWWSGRYEDGEKALRKYLSHRDFDKYHTELIARPLREKQIDIVYAPSLSLGSIRTELDKKMSRLKPRVILVDYINQVKRSSIPNRMGQYDWTEQIEVSKALKTFAQDYDVLMVSPYQIDATGEARFAKGILDAADAAFTLETYYNKDRVKENIITFECAKMRTAEEKNFTSIADWDSLKFGPESASIPSANGNDEEAYDDVDSAFSR